MWLDEVGEVVEMFRGSFPLSFLFFIPLLVMISPITPASAAHDFAVYRMQQYDLQGSSRGCRAALVNVEAQPISALSFLRKCVVAKVKDLTIDRFKDAVQQNAGGLLVIIPSNLSELANTEKEHVQELEQDLLQEETQLPVFFTHETPELMSVYDDISKSVGANTAGSAAEAMMGSVLSNGFQFIVSGSQPKALNDFQIVNLQGKLVGHGIEEQLPTVAIVAHYDAFGVAPSLSFGADSNGSGVVALLELARLFAKLYASSRSHARYNMLFLLTGAGKFNYQGTKRWLDDQIESGESGLLSDVAYVMCLDSIGSGSELYVHVSKPPKNDSAVDFLLKSLEAAGQSSSVDVQMVHKKINLADEYLAWEHERFSIRRLPAFSISHFNSHKAVQRNTLLDTRETVDIAALSGNIRIIAESVAQQIYNLTEADMPQLFTNGLSVNDELLAAWMQYLSSRPRAAQLLHKDSDVVLTLEHALTRHLKDVRRHAFKPDKRDPECMFYSGAEYTMNAYSVKPAVFDLFLGIAIAAYLAIIYAVVQHFGHVYTMVKRLNADHNSLKKVQ